MILNFQKNKIISEKEELAKNLKQARERKNYSIEKVGKDLKISQEYLSYLEMGKFEKLPPGIYREKILREYANYLNVNCKECLEKIKKNSSINDKKNLFANKKINNESFYLSKLLKTLAIIIIFTLCFTYLQNRLKELIKPPTLNILSPKEKNIITEEKVIKIAGSTETEAEISVNGEILLGDDKGFFEKDISLKKGINIIKITAKKKYGKEKIIVKQVLVK